ncbi:MAG TPA: Ig-like domain-containing protein [Gemmatimonadaceae bacterium]
MPRIITFFNELAPRIDSVMADFDAHRPSVLSSSIKDGTADVDPAPDTITVRFDRPMGAGYSIIPADGGDLPTVTTYAFDSTRTVLTMHAALEANHAYAVDFTGAGFASDDGYPLKDFVIRFHTR